MNDFKMRLELINNTGYIILDDDTGRILSVYVKDAVEGKSDFITLSSYSNEDGKHYAVKLTPTVKQEIKNERF